ncbi:uncharacterized protein TNCV_1818521 [Trichonephila clavipes]|nr:uncharacterized protein TNCV_1818521 [Trichonephila clavipes]
MVGSYSSTLLGDKIFGAKNFGDKVYNMATLPDCPVRWLTYGHPKTVRKLGEQGNKAVLGWVMKEGLIPSRYECQKCKKDMLLVERKGTIDGFEWRCRVQSKENPHFVCRSVRKGMWFSHSRLSICV